MNRPANRKVGIALVVWALVLCLGVGLALFARRPRGISLDLDGSARAQAVRSERPYDLSQLRNLTRTLGHLVTAYVDPSRLDARRMLLGALNRAQWVLAPLLVEAAADGRSVTVRISGETRTYDLSSVQAPWDIDPKLTEIFRFVQDHVGDDEEVDLRLVENAAINGMLATLDPHSVFLDPESFADMRVNTRGEFGGLGLVIGIRDEQLTVIRPIANTPASRAGLVGNDRIVRIEDESTTTMLVTEAADRLRGAPGTNVRIWVVRPGEGGWTTPRRFALERARIHVESVTSDMLGDGVGYIRIASFQQNTHEDTAAALARLHEQGLRSLVLDLRDDPGGLLEAAVRVADLFLTEGVIVSIRATEASQRDVKMATAARTEPNYPLVVLVNSGSASASEIVAGALQFHHRALIVGERTFGKGSVQMLYDDYEDGSALKLTISQYMNGGEVSIQGVGVRPDVALSPMTADRNEMDLVPPAEVTRESDLFRSLNGTAPQQSESPVEVRYYLPSDVRDRIRHAAPEELEENRVESQFLLSFARRLLAQSHAENSDQLRAEAERLAPELSRAEAERLATELTALGIDWGTGTDQGASDVAVEVSTTPSGVAQAGQDLQLRVRVTNQGANPLYRLSAVTVSDFGLFADRELVFGRLDPGQSREWTTTLGACERAEAGRAPVCRLPRSLINRSDALRLRFTEANGHAPPEAMIETTIETPPRPQFGYQVHVVDLGNHDGALQPGEQAAVYLRVRNNGRGAAQDLHAQLRNLSGRGVLVRDGRFRTENLRSGAEHVYRFTFEVLADYADRNVRLQFAVSDTPTGEEVVERLEVEIEPVRALSVARRSLRLRPGAILYGAPRADAIVVGRVDRGVLTVDSGASTEGYVRVELTGDEQLWARNSDLVTSGTGGRFVPSFAEMPPQVTLEPGSSVTQSDHISLRGFAQDNERIRDVVVFVGLRKVSFRPADSDTATRIDFDVDLPLRPGTNVIRVFARGGRGSAARSAWIVRREGPNGEILETPRDAEELGEASLAVGIGE